MPIVYCLDPAGGNSTINGIGLIVAEEQEQFFNLDLSFAIAADIAETLGSTITYAHAWWSINTKAFFDAQYVESFIGDPLRWKLGTITYDCKGIFSGMEFINYQFQSYNLQACLVVPPDFFAVPFTVAEIPSLQYWNTIQPQINNSFISASMYVQSAKKTGGLFGNTGFRSYICPGVKVSYSIIYYFVAETKIAAPGTSFLGLNL